MVIPLSRKAEVRGSIPLRSTNRINDLRQGAHPAFFICHTDSSLDPSGLTSRHAPPLATTGAVGIKFWDAYLRTLRIANVQEAQAAVLYAKGRIVPLSRDEYLANVCNRFLSALSERIGPTARRVWIAQRCRAQPRRRNRTHQLTSKHRPVTSI